MASWEVRTRSRAVQVEGANWLLAVGVALPALDLDATVLSRLVCDVQADGVVRILDPVSRTPLLVRRLPDEVTADGARRVVPVGVVATGGVVEDDSTEIPAHELTGDPGSTDEVDLTAPPPPPLHLSTPPAPPPPTLAPSSPTPAAPVAATRADPTQVPQPAAAPPPPVVQAIVPDVPRTPAARFSAADIATLDDIEIPDSLRQAPLGGPALPPVDLAEQLFVRSMDINDALDIEQAAQTTLALLRTFVPAEAGSVLYAGINDTSLRFLAADGPSADEVRGITVPLGHGIAGFCFDTGAALIIRNAGQDPRHLHDVDQQTGYHTGDMLSVAVRDGDGGIHGCLQLLNPPRGFAEWHLEAANTLAATLADFIRSRA
ncbi:GAF domain-containing protein [Myxococcota bacterium]|nr:GAF domain-containing protein [Myxococcota bacterium]